MSEKISFWGGLVRFDPAHLIFCIFGAAFFFAHWYISYRRTSWKIDYWNFTVFFGVFIPTFVMYPVSASLLQAPATGMEWFSQLDKHIEEAFEISAFGYMSLLLGRACFDAFGPSKSSVIVQSIFLGLEKTIHKNIKSGATLIVLLLIAVPSIGIVLYLSSGAGYFKARDYFLEHAAIRPLYNLLVSAYPLIPLFYWLQHSDDMRRRHQFVLITLILLSALLGARAVLLTSALGVYIFIVFNRCGKVSFFQAGAALSLLALVSAIIGAIRGGGSGTSALVGFWQSVFYGNALSDLRDFAWALSSLGDQGLLYGKTYLAAILSFIPRSLSDFRENWALGVVTARLVGLSPEQHAGIRPGLFGEAYLNFGLLGVFALGSVNGFLLRYADSQIKRRVEAGEGICFAYCASVPYIVSSAFFITSGFFSLYVFIAIQIAATLLRRAASALRQASITSPVLDPQDDMLHAFKLTEHQSLQQPAAKK